ncbi:MAG: hypothetical protein PHV20_03715 [Bacteroidales bacterium]|nr:hypothetical protein [Bacteroidales bacterium]
MMIQIKAFQHRFLIVLFLAFIFPQSEFAFTPKNTTQELQLGISGIASYGKPLFANAMYDETRGWKSTNETSFPLQSNQIGSDGYPLYLTPGQSLYVQPGQNSALNATAYGGRICVSWEGEADITVVSATYLSGSPATGSVLNGKRFYNNGTKPNGVYLKVISINAANPPKNIKIWLNDLRNPSLSLDPSEQSGKEYLLHPSFVSLFGNETFTLYRLMNLTETVDSKIVNWSDRRMPNHCFQKGVLNGLSMVGISYEKAIQICNELGKDMWINIPPMANQNFVENLARLIDGQDPDGTGCAGLNKDLRCFVEWGNEMGWSYWINECNAWGAAEAPAISGRQYAGRQQARTTSWFRNIVGANNEQYKFIHAIQTSELSNSDAELEQSCTLFGPTLTPSGKPDYIGVTSYFGSKIEQYVFDNINYWDTSVQAAELGKTFTEFEKRTLSLSSSVTGVDYTGGGIPSSAQTLSSKYNLPFMIYEGGCGLNLASSQTSLDCKIVPKGTSGGTFNVFLNNLADACHTNGKVLYTNFIRAIHSDSRMSKMLEINNCIVKSIGVETMSQFGDVADPALGIDYGYWGCKTDYLQDPATSYRYNFWTDWYNEQKNIREVGHSTGAGGAPSFLTDATLSPARVDEPMIREIYFGGGDGSLEVKMINQSSILPSSLQFNLQGNKIVISGTPTLSDVGTCNFMYRLLDTDKDPAYRIFSLQILPPPSNTLFAGDDFGTTDSTPLHGLNTGFGFKSAWSELTNSLTSFVTKTSSPLLYPTPHTLPSLLCSQGARVNTTTSYTYYASRILDVSKFDYLINPTDANNIGQPGASLWFSSLFSRSAANTAKLDIFQFRPNSANTISNRTQAPVIITLDADGKFSLDCLTLSGTFVTIPTNITASINTTYFVVVEIKFGLTNDVVNLYINPANYGGTSPSILPSASDTTEVGQVTRIAKIAITGKIAMASYDDFRFGDTYRAVSPIEDLTVINQSPKTALSITYSNHLLYIKSNEEHSLVQIFDAMGKLVFSKHIDFQANPIPITTEGIYIVKVNEKSNHLSKIIAVKPIQ